MATDGLREITAHHRVIGQTTDHNSLEVLVKERFFYFLFQIPGGVYRDVFVAPSICVWFQHREGIKQS